MDCIEKIENGNNFMLDTCFINDLIDTSDHKIINILKNKTLFYTSVQESEIRNIKDENKRSKILDLLKTLNMSKLQRKMMQWNDDLYWDDDDLMCCDESEAYIAINKNTKSDADGSIFDVCISNKLILITSDKKFNNKCGKFDESSVIFYDKRK